MTVNKKNIPALIQAMLCWLVWRYEPREDGKQTKVPYSVHGGRASTTNPATWAGYEEAVQLYEAGGYDGVGICVSDGIGAIDIDHCVKDGELTPMAAEIIAKMNSYTEYSPSGVSAANQDIGSAQGFRREAASIGDALSGYFE